MATAALYADVGLNCNSLSLTLSIVVSIDGSAGLFSGSLGEVVGFESLPGIWSVLSREFIATADWEGQGFGRLVILVKVTQVCEMRKSSRVSFVERAV